MPSPARSRSKQKAARARRDIRWFYAGFAILIGVCALGVYVRHTMPVSFSGAASAHADAYTPPAGSILFLPFSGNVCHQSVIDNVTYEIRDNGIVDCNVALLRSDREKEKTGDRLGMMRNSFSRK